jgi:hypothetical protein
MFLPEILLAAITSEPMLRGLSELLVTVNEAETDWFLDGEFELKLRPEVTKGLSSTCKFKLLCILESNEAG